MGNCRERDSRSWRAHCAPGGVNSEKQKSGDGWRGSRLGGRGAGATAELIDTKKDSRCIGAQGGWEERGVGGGRVRGGEMTEECTGRRAGGKTGMHT